MEIASVVGDTTARRIRDWLDGKPSGIRDGEKDADS
jgi:hypothetical protein